jgi:hypothetical protein
MKEIQSLEGWYAGAQGLAEGFGATYFRRNQLYGGLSPLELPKMRQLKEDNLRLKRVDRRPVAGQGDDPRSSERKAST